MDIRTTTVTLVRVEPARQCLPDYVHTSEMLCTYCTVHRCMCTCMNSKYIIVTHWQENLSVSLCSLAGVIFLTTV